MKKILFLFILFISFNSQSSFAKSYNYFNKDNKCLKVSDIQDIEGHFKQFQKFTTSKKSEVCRNEVGEKWYEVIRTVLAIQRLTATDTVQRDVNDDMTRKALPNKDWWAYFSQRADGFVIEPSYCSTNANIVASVEQWVRGIVNLCPSFFTADSVTQISVLMHEVRHFEGYHHVRCTQGYEIGTPGGCDEKISSAGSYAVSIQTLIELSFVDQLSEANRILSELNAIYMANDRFNILPIAKYTNYIYASNKDGEIWRMAETTPAKPELMATLSKGKESYIYGGRDGYGVTFTFYPINSSLDVELRAYKHFEHEAESIGSFAKMYNADNPRDRKLYGAVSYYGIGSIVKDNQLYTFCGAEATSLSATPFDNGKIQALPILKDAKDRDHMYILSNSGDMFDFKCNDKTGKTSITSVASKLPADATSAFSFDTKIAYIVTTSGSLKSYNMDTGAYESDLSTDTNWLNATPASFYQVFDNNNL